MRAVRARLRSGVGPQGLGGETQGVREVSNWGGIGPGYVNFVYCRLTAKGRSYYYNFHLLLVRGKKQIFLKSLFMK